MQDEIIAVYEKEEEIAPLREKLKVFSFGDLIKLPHFYYSLDEKITDLQFITNKFAEFDRIELIVKRKHKKSQKTNYDFYYHLDEGYYVIYSIDLDGNRAVLINAYYVQRNFKRYKEWLTRAYKDKLIG